MKPYKNGPQGHRDAAQAIEQMMTPKKKSAPPKKKKPAK
jgi:hypothetical protein|tara:strand:+ start:458 stop:574 length:117 start_codon:yes stop_codon:yes gene_type:complete